MNRSPWLHTLERTRPLYRLDAHRHDDVVVVGGGIAGVMTAAFALLETRRSVLLLEATRIAHGATGHNAGQIVSYFERELPALAKSFGKRQAGAGLAAIESGWELLETLRKTFRLETPVFSFPGYVGFGDAATLRMFLDTMRLRAELKLPYQPLYLDEQAVPRLRLRPADAPFFTTLPRERLHALLETPEPGFFGVHAARKGVTNSAALTEELAGALLARYPERFMVLEETPVHEIRFEKKAVELTTKLAHTIHAETVVLCTNGFESLHLRDDAGSDLDRRFHDAVQGDVGYMAGYETPRAEPAAISYLEPGYAEGTAYAYLTRRPFAHGSLVCWGGPERALPEDEPYERTAPVPEATVRQLKGTIARLRPADKRKPLLFRWHGLMGYTKSGVRLIGADKKEPRLLYNLGCNGVGILPSIYGGFRIGEILQGKKAGKTIFDPK